MNMRRLIPRVVGIMTLALLPLGAISIWQTNAVVSEAERILQSSLLVETVAQASSEREILQRALGAATGLSSAPLTLEKEACSDVMREFILHHPEFIFAGFVPLDGQMDCSSADEVVDLRSIPNFDEEVRRADPSITLNMQGSATGEPVIIVSTPVRTGNAIIGQLSISVPKAIVTTRLRSMSGRSDDTILISIAVDGTLIAASGDFDDARVTLPEDLLDGSAVALEGTSFSAPAVNGEDRIFAVVELVEDALYLVGSVPAESKSGTALSSAWWTAMIFPVLMWFAGVSVAVLGMQHLVLRHIRDLRSAMRQFALGERNASELVLDRPPLELEEAARAFNRMTLVVSEAEERREADLRDKEVLLKEVHHRVKNNLQLIASIMSMQGRKAQSDEAASMLAGLQRRVRGLAMLHRTLYTTPDLTTVDARELIETVIAEASNLAASKSHIVAELDNCALYPDQAVPLSMLVAEALTNAIKYSDPAALRNEPVRVILESYTENVMRLRVSNPVDGSAEPAEGDGIGTQLMSAFVRQLEGTLGKSRQNGTFTLDLTFLRRDFEGVPDD